MGLAHQDNGAIGANGKKSRMPKAYLTGIAHNNTKPDDQERVIG